MDGAGPRSLTHSLLIAAMTAPVSTLIASAAGYTFARIPVPGRGVLPALVVATLMIPGSVTFVPTFVVVGSMGGPCDPRIAWPEPGRPERRPGPPPPTGEAPVVFRGAAGRPRTHLSAVTAISVTPRSGRRMLRLVQVMDVMTAKDVAC
ncbi:hypothetical protein ACGFR8_04165 [Streptomyces brevispora]|uniref:hypothetical protein n=1 Tax=Streptomyces brevispora TaxID=887462 RepID=UPI0037211CE5